MYFAEKFVLRIVDNLLYVSNVSSTETASYSSYDNARNAIPVRCSGLFSGSTTRTRTRAVTFARLFRQSLTTSVVPRQWKTAVITPTPKIAASELPSDFRPISITPVLSRLLEKFVVREFIYPALL